MMQIAFLIEQYGVILYILCGLGILVFLRSYYLARQALSGAQFELEKEIEACRPLLPTQPTWLNQGCPASWGTFCAIGNLAAALAGFACKSRTNSHAKSPQSDQNHHRPASRCLLRSSLKARQGGIDL